MNSESTATAIDGRGDRPAARNPARADWHLITGEYPPQNGGVADYTRLVAQELARIGCGVHVWAPATAEEASADPGVIVHRLPGHFGLTALVQLQRELSHWPQPRHLLVQYVPHLYGWKAMNVLFCLWLTIRYRKAYQIMFHEVAYAHETRQRWRHRLLATVTHWMAARLARSAERIYISTTSWEPLLRSLAPDCGAITLLPVLSTVATELDSSQVARLRRRLAPDETWQVVGHFGTYGNLLGALVNRVFERLLAANPRRVAVLLGKGNDGFAKQFAKQHPELAGRLIAPGVLSAIEISLHLAACDLLVQPYPDGVTTRRSTMMAALALGLPTVTTDGPLTEPLWRSSGAVAVADVTRIDEIVESAETLLADKEQRTRLGERARDLYRRRFSVENIGEILCL